jgi:predicted nucleotidyltransferase
MSIPEEKMRGYIETARRREAERRAALARRREHALTVAHAAAALLRERYGVSRIVLYGSTLRAERFDERSDIDMAVWGLSFAEHYRAWNEIDALDDEIGVDLVRFDEAEPHIQHAIQSEGIDL